MNPTELKNNVLEITKEGCTLNELQRELGSDCDLGGILNILEMQEKIKFIQYQLPGRTYYSSLIVPNGTILKVKL